MSRPKTGIQLPQALREQIDGDNSENARRGKRLSRSKLSRKEARKQERFEKKQRKASFYSTGAAAKRRAPEDHPDSPSRKRTKTAGSTMASAVSRSREAKSNPAIALAQQPTKPPKEPSKKTAPKDTAVKPKPKPKAKPKPKSALQKLAEGSRSGGLPRSQVDRDEEAYIAYLEAKLGMRKGAKRKDGLDEDGLDDLMEGLDNIAGPSRYSSEEMLKLRQETSARSESEDDGSTDGSASKEDSEENDDLKSTGVNVEPSQDVARDDLPQSSERDVVPTEQQQPTRYIPPHLRKNLQSSSDAEAIAKLMRQLKGLLNKLSEPNIASILDDIEELYRRHRRHDITETLTTLIVNGITSHASMLDAFIVLNAALVSALYKIIGIEFAAFFVQNVVSTYDTHYTALSTSDGMVEDETKGKECSNLIVLLSELYNFQVVSCVLVYDIIRTLLDGDLSEMDVELLLKLLRNSGQQLRQDDPLALKDIVQTVQNKVSAGSGSSSSRTRFMIETLINLKNNKTKRAATQHAGGDSAETLKRFLSGLGKKRHLTAHDPLRVTLADLQSADSRGKWWLVGAAWGGDPLAERQHAAPRAAPTSDAESALLKLAKKQGMNTDIRRNIFVVLMSSDDYVDACERLAQLNLTEIQQREIENTYNPYYTLIGQRLAHQSHSHKITLQFCLWDFLREMGETSVGGVELIKSLGPDGAFAVTDTSSVSSSRRRNLARAYAWWLARGVVTLTILKPLEFLSLKPSTRKFVQALLDRVFFDSQTSTLVLSDRLSDLPAKRDRGAIEEVFIKAARAPALAAGLAYFLAEMQKAREGEEDDGKGGNFYTWAYDVAIDTLRTGADVLQAL